MGASQIAIIPLMQQANKSESQSDSHSSSVTTGRPIRETVSQWLPQTHRAISTRHISQNLKLSKNIIGFSNCAHIFTALNYLDTFPLISSKYMLYKRIEIYSKKNLILQVRK